MIKGYYVNIPPLLSDVLADLASISHDSDFDDIITASRTLLFDFSYPVSTADKEGLETYILNYYMTRRISSGNFKKWKQWFKAKLLEIMPYYKQLMDSEKLTYEPLINNDLTTTDEGSGTSDTVRDNRTDNDDSYSKGGSETTSVTELNRFSDTPQGDSSRIWEVVNGVPRLTDYYVTDVRGITTNGNRTWNESGTDNRDITDHETTDNDTTHENTNYKLGVSGSSKSNLLKEYRETFLRIYGMIAEELQPLFYNLLEVDDLIDYV